MGDEILFTPIRVGALQLPNRIVMAPMTRNRAGKGNVPTPLAAQYYRQRATAGLIVTEGTQVTPRGVGSAEARTRCAAELGEEGDVARLPDAARHHRALHAGLLQDADDLAELADAHPGALAHEVGDRLGRLVLVRDGDHLGPNTPGIHSPEQVEGWTGITKAVHDAGGRIVLQLWHVGRSSHPLYQPNGDPPVSSSAIAIPGEVYTPQGMKPFPVPRALETSEIAGVVADFARGAANARAAGFDGVEIHGANGYLVDQFLRDGVNKRSDIYGGNVENRLRFMKEVVTAVAAAWEPSRVGIRLSPSGTFNGMSDSDPVATFSSALQALSALKIAYVHVVEPVEADQRHGGPGWKSASARELRRHFKGIYIAAAEMTKDKVAAMIRGGLADAAAFARLYISNPDLVSRFRKGAPLAPSDPDSYYGGTAKGYTDYPALI